MTLTEVESMVKSCVLSKKGDMTVNELKEEYFELVGQDIPFEELGYDNLETLLNKLPGISIKKNARGQPIVLVYSKKSAHIADLVNRQNTSKKTHNVRGKVSFSPRGASRLPVHNISKTNRSLNHFHESKGKTLKPLQTHSPNIPSSSYDQTLKMKPKSRKVASNRRRLSSTQVRFIPAGEEDDSFDEDFDCSSKMLTKDSFVHQQSLAKFGSNNIPKAKLQSSVNNDFASGQHRVVNMTENTLICTISVNPSLQSKDKKLARQTSSSNIVCCGTKDSGRHSSWDDGPAILGYNLVGDDFLLHFAYECLQVQCEWEDTERLSYGMCISGQTIHDFHMQVCHEGFIQPKLMLMLGTVDILQGTSLRRIIEDTTDFLEDMISSPVQSLVFLTLPYLKNSDVLVNRKVLLFNDFLRTLDNGGRFRVLDTHHLFNKRSLQLERVFENCINSKCYEDETRDVLCYPQGIVLWSHIGRTYLFNFLLQKLPELNNKVVTR